MNIYYPFKELQFSANHCFLCGASVGPEVSLSAVFPEWLMRKHELRSKPFKLLDESIVNFGTLSTPCCVTCGNHLKRMEEKVSDAFSVGYHALQKIDPFVLFQWFAKILYGIIFNEIRTAIAQNDTGAPLGLSPSLITKFGNLHLMLQTLRLPMEIEFKPFSLILVRTAPSTDFSYRDEMNTLVFSLTTSDFGLIACLQDNGENEGYQRAVLQKIGGKALESNQFQELCARFYYSAYLYHPIPEYLVIPPAGKSNFYSVDVNPIISTPSQPLFNRWSNDMYAQVLESFWQPWSISKNEILRDGEVSSML